MACCLRVLAGGLNLKRLSQLHHSCHQATKTRRTHCPERESGLRGSARSRPAGLVRVSTCGIMGSVCDLVVDPGRYSVSQDMFDPITARRNLWAQVRRSGARRRCLSTSIARDLRRPAGNDERSSRTGQTKAPSRSSARYGHINHPRRKKSAGSVWLLIFAPTWSLLDYAGPASPTDSPATSTVPGSRPACPSPAQATGTPVVAQAAASPALGPCRL